MTGDQVVIKSLPGHQFVVTAALYQTSLAQTVDHVRLPDGRQAMGNNDRCPTFTRLDIEYANMSQ